MFRYAATALLAITLVLSFSAGARAGFIDGSFNCTFADESDQEYLLYHTWSFNYTSNTLDLHELNIASMGTDHVTMSVTTDNVDPTFTVGETVQNNSGVTWTDYHLYLPSGGPITFTGGAASSFSGVTVTPYQIDFIAQSGETVPDGSTFAAGFSVNVPSSGLFSWTLTQQPSPEPATMALLAMGGIGLLVVRRRRA